MKNKEKYNLNEFEIKLINTLSGYKIKVFCKDKIIYERTHLADNDNKKIEGFFNWLEQEYKPPILTDKEKAYLSAVIKPFRERIECVKKIVFKRAFIKIFLEDEAVALPYFEKDIMYTGMEEGREYTLEELGL
ncbi:MAG: hypothetical protein HXN67_09745 [Prevotella pallens]|nr:hypothetical protein [Prevotella pallens]